jgi:hypothetical protein
VCTNHLRLGHGLRLPRRKRGLRMHVKRPTNPATHLRLRRGLRLLRRTGLRLLRRIGLRLLRRTGLRLRAAGGDLARGWGFSGGDLLLRPPPPPRPTPPPSRAGLRLLRLRGLGLLDSSQKSAHRKCVTGITHSC